MLIYRDYEKYIKEYLNNQMFFDLYQMGIGEKKYYINFVPMGFDIETYTQYTTKTVMNEKGMECEKVTSHFTNMYIWQFSFGPFNFAGRTWDEFDNLIHLIDENLCINYVMDEKEYPLKTIAFIHNMGFEFSFFGKELITRGHTISIFARQKRHPLKCVIDDKIIFLDSAAITGYSLAKLAENITKKTQKLVGDLDYSIPRNQYTKLTPEEEGYCENDVRILAEYAEYYKDNYLDLEHPYMPMTQTMIANRVLKDTIRKMKCQKDVAFLMLKLYPKSWIQYEYIMQYFSGAYTHGNVATLFETVEDAKGADVCSEYPYISLFFGGFPMSKWKPMRTECLQEEYLKTHCCLCKCTFKNLRQKYCVTILSKHKAYDFIKSECVWDNGRLWKCNGSITFYLTEIDIEMINLFYEYDGKIEISEMLVAKRGFLPDYYRLTIANLYRNKDKLKGVEDKEIEYMNSKAALNSLAYGAMATKLSNTELYIDENGEWNTKENALDFEKMWYKKDKSPSWSIYVTSAARRHILMSVYEIVKRDRKAYLYSDTDSNKYKNLPWIDKMFDDLNVKIKQENEKIIKELQLDILYPDVDFSRMGQYEPDGYYNKIKCLGSKRYLTETDGKLHATVAGLPRGRFESKCEELKKKDEKFNPFEYFSENLFFNEEDSKKLTAYYMDKPQDFTVEDLQGNVEEIHTESYVSLIPTSFNLTIDEMLMMLHMFPNMTDKGIVNKEV